MADMRLVLRITGDASGLKAEVVGAKSEIDQLGQSGASAGNQAAGGMDRLAAGATRALGVLAGFATIATAIYSVARAGDAMNASLGQLTVATGDVASAADVYERLYQISMRTGVAVGEGAAAFQRFAIAARSAGATREDILTIVQLLQQAGAVAGASTQETASATLQLGQALASGKLQGDELRSILEAMPNLAEALARELGVGIGELRKMGEEGKLTAEVVIPALTRAAGGMNAEFERLPPSLSRSTAILGESMTRLLADLDKALGLSVGLARAMAGVASAADSIRVRAFPSAAQMAANDETAAQARVQGLQAEIARLEGGGAVQARRGSIGPAMTEAAAQLRGNDERIADLRAQLDRELEVAGAAQIRRQAIENEGDLRAFEDARQATERRAAAARAAAEAGLTELRGQLDRRIAIRREASEREARVATALAAGVVSAETAAGLRRDIARERDEELAKLDRPRGSGRSGTRAQGDDGLTNTLQALRQQQQEAQQLTTSLRRPVEVLNDEMARYSRLLAAGAIDQETFNRAMERAGETYRRSITLDEAGQQASRTLQEVGRLGERSMDRIGQAITAATVEGKFSFEDMGRAGTAVASELTQAFLQLALINPAKNWLTGGNSATLNGLFSSLSGSFGSGTGLFYGSGPSTASASAGGFLFHTGGVAGRDAAASRHVPATLYASAPRFHGGNGVGPGELPAILRKGEGVFTEAQMAAMGPAGGTYTFSPIVQFSGDAGSASDRDQLIQSMRGLWQADLQRAVPGIVAASKASLRGDVHRMGTDRALGSIA